MYAMVRGMSFDEVAYLIWQEQICRPCRSAAARTVFAVSSVKGMGK
jgi:hypothetical protein